MRGLIFRARLRLMDALHALAHHADPGHRTEHEDLPGGGMLFYRVPHRNDDGSKP